MFELRFVFARPSQSINRTNFLIRNLLFFSKHRNQGWSHFTVSYNVYLIAIRWRLVLYVILADPIKNFNGNIDEILAYKLNGSAFAEHVILMT